MEGYFVTMRTLIPEHLFRNSLIGISNVDWKCALLVVDWKCALLVEALKGTTLNLQAFSLNCTFYKTYFHI